MHIKIISALLLLCECWIISDTAFPLIDRSDASVTVTLRPKSSPLLHFSLESLPDLKPGECVLRDLKWPAFTEETVMIRVDELCSLTQSWTDGED